jgi:anti-sigma factor RsiW
MTRRGDSLTCDEVQMAALARLDGEAATLTFEEIDAHVASCHACRAAVADLTTLHAHLDHLDYGQIDVDLWPMVHSRAAATSPHPSRRESGAILGLTAVLITWRLAQLLLDLPAPVINSVVPLALIILVLWRVTGDPFSIRVTPFQLEREGAS